MKSIPDHTKWTQYKQTDVAEIDHYKYPVVSAKFYKKMINNVEWSSGVFSVDGKIVMTAWGVKSEPHCSSHAVKIGDSWSKPQNGCPIVSPVNANGKTVGVEFTIQGRPYKIISA